MTIRRQTNSDWSTRAKVYHFTRALRELHWLPIAARVQYKLLSAGALCCCQHRTGLHERYTTSGIWTHVPAKQSKVVKKRVKAEASIPIKC